MAKRSEFKRLVKLEKGLPKQAHTFIEEAGYKRTGGIMDAWIKGDFKTAKDFVLVYVNEKEGGYDILYRNTEGTIVVENQPNLYQTFLAHKAARFQ